MHKKRLLKLADLLEKDAKDKKGLSFDLDTWGGTEDDKTKPSVSCGTVGCALGLAALSGEFKRAGLSYKVKKHWEKGYYIQVKFGRKTEFAAAAELFDIELEEADALFASSYLYEGEAIRGAKGERNVAKAIRKFVAKGKLPPDPDYTAFD